MTRRRAPPASPRRQTGVVLIFAIIFLSVLALLGASAAMNNTLQERMAGNTRSRDLAFQAAEAALRDAEKTIGTWRVASFNGSNGLFCGTDDNDLDGVDDNGDGVTDEDNHANSADYWRDSSHWTSHRSLASVTLTSGLLSAEPYYLVEKRGCNTTQDVEYYRVTARGVGKDANAVVVLQAGYAYSCASPPCTCTCP